MMMNKMDADQFRVLFRVLEQIATSMRRMADAAEDASALQEEMLKHVKGETDVTPRRQPKVR